VIVLVSVPGQPQGKGRVRFARRGSFVHAYTPEKTVAYEGLIALAAQKVMDGWERFSGPVDLTIRAVFQMPRSWSKKKRAAALVSPHWHINKPDGDNILKAVGDGLNTIVWNDDSQIARCSITKTYGETAGLTILVRPLAQGIEAGTDETRSGSAEGESPVAKPCAQGQPA
jgi:Holliday junction resolvase RusA-like endonuclease